MTIHYVAFGNMALSDISRITRQTIVNREAWAGIFPEEGSREGLPIVFRWPREGAQPLFLVASIVKMKEFRESRGIAPSYLCLPTPLSLDDSK